MLSKLLDELNTLSLRKKKKKSQILFRVTESSETQSIYNTLWWHLFHKIIM